MTTAVIVLVSVTGVASIVIVALRAKVSRVCPVCREWTHKRHRDCGRAEREARRARVMARVDAERHRRGGS